MKFPTQLQIDIAILWLESNEGIEGESEACKAVAAFLDHQAYENYLRHEARKSGVAVAQLRRRLRPYLRPGLR